MKKLRWKWGIKNDQKNSKKRQRSIKITIIKDDRDGNLPLKLYMMILGNGKQYSYCTT